MDPSKPFLCKVFTFPFFWQSINVPDFHK
jgi:hypothetical protein